MSGPEKADCSGRDELEELWEDIHHIHGELAALGAPVAQVHAGLRRPREELNERLENIAL